MSKKFILKCCNCDKEIHISNYCVWLSGKLPIHVENIPYGIKISCSNCGYSVDETVSYNSGCRAD